MRYHRPMDDPSRTYTLRTSPRLRLALALLYALAALAIWLAALDWRVKATLALGLAVAGLVALRRPPDLTLRCHADGRLAMPVGDDWVTAQVLAATQVLPGLVSLGYRLPGQRRARWRAILADSLPEDDFRRLRIWLRWRAGVGTHRAGMGHNSGTTIEARD